MRDVLIHELREAGLRVTGSRVAVLDALERMPHSDANSIVSRVHDEFPSMSVQSVHNVLADLTRVDLIRRIEPAGSAALYERRIGDNHHHVVCTSCGAVEDVDCVVGEAPCLTPASAAGFVVHTAEVTFWGLCPSCLAMTQPEELRPAEPNEEKK
jgi:Fur family ferric uptake transcriptional regulator